MIAGSYKSDKPINFTGIDKVHLKCDCIHGSIMDGTQELILCSFAWSSPPGRKIYKEPRIKLFKKVNKSVLSHIIFYLEDDSDKPVDFHNETISFTCQLIEYNIHIYIHTIIPFGYVQFYLCLYKCIITIKREVFYLDKGKRIFI